MGRCVLRRQVTESLGDTGCGVMGAGGAQSGGRGGHRGRDGAALDQVSGWEMDEAVNSGETSRFGIDWTS